MSEKIRPQHVQNLAIERATEILKKRGDQPRFKQNRLIFLVADYDSVSRLKDQVRSTLAWQSIVSDIKELKLNLDQLQARQANKSLEDANEALRRMIRETYKWLVAPMQEARLGKGLSELQWEHFQVNPGAQNWSQEIERVLKENELLINEWAPIHLATVLKNWFWKENVKEVSALNVWQQSCQQLYLPRLKDERVFQQTLAAGTKSQDFFGLAQGKEYDHYLGFLFGKETTPILDQSLLLIEPTTAAEYAEAQRIHEEVNRSAPIERILTTNSNSPSRVEAPANPVYYQGDNATLQTVKKQFYGNIELDPIRAKQQFADLIDEIVQQFTIRPDVKVQIAVEIRAESATGFDGSLQRTVKENCNVLHFKNAEFEDKEN